MFYGNLFWNFDYDSNIYSVNNNELLKLVNDRIK